MFYLVQLLTDGEFKIVDRVTYSKRANIFKAHVNLCTYATCIILEYNANRNELVRKLNLLNEEREKMLYNAMRCSTQQRLKMELNNKGRSVYAATDFKKHEIVTEYKGFLMTGKEAEQLEKKFEVENNNECFMFYFMHRNKKYCLNATEENGSYGRLVNHSVANANVIPKIFKQKNEPHLFYMADRHIKAGEEILVDYGDRRKGIRKALPWLSPNYKENEISDTTADVESPSKVAVIHSNVDLYPSLSTYNKFVDNLMILKRSIATIDDRRETFENQRVKKNRGLAHDNVLYAKLILALRDLDIDEKLCISDETKLEIVEKVYKNQHPSSYNSLEKFLKQYKMQIIEDVKDMRNSLLSPSYKSLQSYLIHLTATCILNCPIKFGICIYSGEKMALETKNLLLKEMHGSEASLKKNRIKLDNSLQKYKLRMQEIVQDFISTVLTENEDEDTPKRVSDVSSDPPNSFSDLTMAEINEMLGLN